MISQPKDKTQANQQYLMRTIDWFAFAGNIIFVFAFLTALIAFVLLAGWLIVSSYSPSPNYKDSISLTPPESTEALQIEYPKLILANDKSATISFTLSGESDIKTFIKVFIPPTLRMLGFRLDATEVERILEFNPSKAGDLPQTEYIQLLNSRAVTGLWYFSEQVIKIQVLSGNISLSSKQIIVKTETVWWAGLRDFINNSVNDKSPLILLVTGFISGAGTLIFQYLKDQRERKKEKDEKEETALEKYKSELRLGIQSHPVIAIRNNIDRLFRTEPPEGFEKSFITGRINAFREIAKENDCEKTLAEEVIKELRNEHYPKVKQLLIDMEVLSDEIRDNNGYWLMLSRLTGLRESLNKKELSIDDAKCLLEICKNWTELARPILIDLVRKYTEYKVGPNNLPFLFSVLGNDDEFGQPLLRDAKIDDQIDLFYGDLTLSEQISSSVRELKGILQSRINWRPLLPNQKKKVSLKLKKWLAYWGHNNNFIPFGSEFGELELYLEKYKIEHPVLNQVGDPNPVLVFGGEGTGKTTTAFLTILNCQKSDRGLKESGAFPVYAKFKPIPSFNEWIVTCISRAIIDFVSDNPRSFLNAGIAAQIAMSRLMLRQTKGIEKLRISLQQSGYISNDECEQILEMVKKMGVVQMSHKLDDAEVLELLYMAVPDGFDRVYFLLDIPNTTQVLEASAVLNEFKELVLSLTRISLYVKIFAPMELESQLGNISMFKREELNWTDELLRTLIDRRFEGLKGCCDTRKGLDPHTLLIKEAKGSPRNLIKYGNALIDYVDKNFVDMKRLNDRSFVEAKKMLVSAKKLKV